MAGWKVIASLGVLVLVSGGSWLALARPDLLGGDSGANSGGDTKTVSSRDNEDGEAAGTGSAGAAGGLPAGVTQAQYDRAARMFRNFYPGQEPDRLDTYSMAGELAVNEEQLDEAVHWFDAIPTSHPKYGLPARLQAGAALIQLHRLAAAERNLREYWQVMKQSETVNLPHLLDAFKRLEYLLSLEIRLEERADLLIEVHRAGLADIRDSKHLFFPNLLILNSTTGRETIQAALREDPTSVKLRIARARYLTLEGAYDEAIAMWQTLQTEEPENRAVLAGLLEAYWEANEIEPFEQLAAELPSYQDSEPWLLTRMRGEAAVLADRHQDAINHFQNLLARDPTNPPAQMALAAAWGRVGDKERQQAALQRAATLAEIRVNLTNVQGDTIKALDELVEKCQQIEFAPAAEMFAVHAKALREQQAAVQQ